jgi:hypothetical protein
VCCAVREDTPVPAFLSPENWSYSYTARSRADLPVGFQPCAAHEAANRLGFYLFQDIGA